MSDYLDEDYGTTDAALQDAAWAGSGLRVYTRGY